MRNSENADERDEIAKQLMFSDPDPQEKGMLLSDRIRFYVENLSMISPFHESHLRAASYELTLGAEYLFNRDNNKPASVQKLGPDDELVIPPNSIVFVSTEEKLTLPFYIAARFNVKVNLVYEGLLLGTGPQVDPGFRGRLSCPLHNISSQEVRLQAGESFAVIDFEKTTTFAGGELDLGRYSTDELRRRGVARELRGFKGHPCLTYPLERLDRQVILGLIPRNKSVSSSLSGLTDRLQSAETSVKTGLARIDSEFKRVNIGLLVAVLVVIASMSGFFWSAVDWGMAVHTDAASEVNRLTGTPADYVVLSHRIAALETEINALRASSTTHGAAPQGH